MQVGCGKTQLVTAFRAMFDATFDTIRAPQHTSREINLAARQQLTNLARAYPTVSETHFGDFSRNKTKFFTDARQQVDVPFTVMTECESFSQINFLRMKSFLDDVVQKLARTNLRKLFREPHYDGLFNPQNSEAFNFLIECLKQRWS